MFHALLLAGDGCMNIMVNELSMVYAANRVVSPSRLESRRSTVTEMVSAHPLNYPRPMSGCRLQGASDSRLQRKLLCVFHTVPAKGDV